MRAKLATNRRQVLRQLGLAGATLMSKSALADSITRLPLASDQRQGLFTLLFRKSGQ
jgi:hypothetical protein